MATNVGPPIHDTASDGVSQLIVQLPQAKTVQETFGLFADKVQHNIFQGLQHIRYAAAGCVLSPASQAKHHVCLRLLHCIYPTCRPTLCISLP